MKKLFIALMMALPLGMFAQDLKIGYINKQDLVALMPEYNQALKQLEDMQLTYVNEGKKLSEEFQKKYQEYQEQEATLDETIKQYKQSELMRLQESIEAFQKSAQETLQKKNQELMEPIITKMDKAIEEVGKANSFTYIIDNTSGVLAYKSAAAIDVLPLVKKQLGL